MKWICNDFQNKEDGQKLQSVHIWKYSKLEMTAPHRIPMNILFSEESSHSAEFRTNQKSSENQCLCTMWNIIHARFWTNKQIINRLTEFGKMARRLMRDSKGEPEEKQIKLDDECSQCSSTTCWNKRKLTTARRWIMIQTKYNDSSFLFFVFFPLPFVSVDISELRWRNRDESLMLGPAPSRAF